jgi:hypothetical protein
MRFGCSAELGEAIVETNGWERSCFIFALIPLITKTPTPAISRMRSKTLTICILYLIWSILKKA